jgi:hypothetical protein
MFTHNDKLQPEESDFLDNLHKDIIKQQEKKRKRTFRIIIALCIIAVMIGGVIGWNS